MQDAKEDKTEQQLNKVTRQHERPSEVQVDACIDAGCDVCHAHHDLQDCEAHVDDPGVAVMKEDFTAPKNKDPVNGSERMHDEQD